MWIPRALGSNVVLPDTEAPLLGQTLSLVQLLCVLREFCTPVHNLAEAHLEKLLADVACRVLNSAVEIIVLVNALKKDAHIAVEQATLNEVLGLASKGLSCVRLPLHLSAFEARAGNTREEDCDPAEGREHEPACSCTVAKLLDEEGLRRALDRLQDLQCTAVSTGQQLLIDCDLFQIH